MAQAGGLNLLSQRAKLAALCIPVLIMGLSQPARAVPGSPGSLDTTFDIDGRVNTLVGIQAGGASVAIQPSDGKVVVAGYAISGSSDVFGVARYNTNGGLDTSFSGNGKVTTSFGSFGANAASVAIQPDGMIVVAGGSTNGGSNSKIAVARYDTNGVLDPNFSSNGKVTLSIGSLNNSSAHAVAIRASGKIVVAGHALTGNGPVFALARFDSSGNLDTTFSGNGIVTTPIGSSASVARSVAIQPDGRIVAGGYATKAGDSVFGVARYRGSGHLDLSFSGDGMVTTPVGNSDSGAWSVAIQPNGRIVAAGDAITGGKTVFALVRYKPTGSLDATFSGGKVTTPVGSSDANAHSVAIQSNGRIVAAGGARNGSNNGVFALVRYNPTGTLDTTFSGGKVTTLVGSTHAIAWGVAIQPSDGNIVAAGSAANSGGTFDFAVTRYDDV